MSNVSNDLGEGYSLFSSAFGEPRSLPPVRSATPPSTASSSTSAAAAALHHMQDHHSATPGRPLSSASVSRLDDRAGGGGGGGGGVGTGGGGGGGFGGSAWSSSLFSFPAVPSAGATGGANPSPPTGHLQRVGSGGPGSSLFDYPTHSSSYDNLGAASCVSLSLSLSPYYVAHVCMC